MSDAGKTCEYVLDPDEPETWGGNKGDECYVDEELLSENGVWDCPHDTKEHERFCIFHSPVNEKDSIEARDRFLGILGDANETGNGEANKSKFQFIGAKFGDFNIEGEYLDSKFSKEINLSHSNFYGGFNWSRTCVKLPVILDGSEFHGSLHFRKSVFAKNLSFEGATIDDDADFYSATLSNISFKNATFNGRASFKLVTFDSISKFDSTSFQSNVSFSDSTFNRDTTFTDINFKTNADFSGVTFNNIIDLSNLNLSDLDFSKATLTNINLSGANLSDTSLRNADLEHSNCAKTNFNRSLLDFADLSSTNLSKASFHQASLKSADISRAKFDDSDFSGANLSGADLSNTDISNADFSDADFSSADLSNSDFSSTNLSSAIIRDADVTGAKLPYILKFSRLAKAVPIITIAIGVVLTTAGFAALQNDTVLQILSILFGAGSLAIALLYYLSAGGEFRWA
jgi:uncharacterized protein YjbI with pentapeptide repeats